MDHLEIVVEDLVHAAIEAVVAIKDERALGPAPLHMWENVAGREMVFAGQPNLVATLAVGKQIVEMLLPFENEHRGRRDVPMSRAMTTLGVESEHHVERASLSVVSEDGVFVMHRIGELGSPSILLQR